MKIRSERPLPCKRVVNALWKGFEAECPYQVPLARQADQELTAMAQGIVEASHFRMLASSLDTIWVVL